MKCKIICKAICLSIFIIFSHIESAVCRYTIMEKNNGQTSNKVIFYQDWHAESFYDEAQAAKVRAYPKIKFFLKR